ncbi:peptidoglycan binding domain protein [Mizugakiibacter sediminis]|uniref:Peptidoglycan binding domain protein n=1 Tax=Mizugakiibacter sediminis TaxID=1475481 RepID=A0A0K8QLJ7_9GAMM|nr:ExeA family protein [Mizugakiibacter sediminis]GAP65738.1 peptidoglycan binding domain protein [Mizugakiibacter sediminis]
MYLEYYSLREQPFAPTPEPRYAFLTPRWRDLLTHLQHLLSGRGGGELVELTGEAGTGKTLLWRLLLAQLPEHVRVACVLQPRLSPEELIETICEQLGVDIAGRRDSSKAMTDALSTYLLDAYAQGQRVLLVIDEAQDLPFPTLEQIRLLTNLETPSQRLLQVILIGQPALRRLLAQPEAGQLGQRVTARYQLQPLDVHETAAYVRHRMMVAGATRVPFTRLGLRALHHHGRGVPRSINLIADRALAAAAADRATEIGERLVGRAAQESLPGHLRYVLRRYGLWIALALLLASALWLPAMREPESAPPPLGPTAAESDVERALATLRAQWPDARSSQLQAWSELLARWQVGSGDVGVEDAARCDAVIFPGFDCVGGSASLEQLQRFDRPLILQLDRGDGARDAVLLGVGRRQVRLRLGSRELQLPRAALDRIWHGRFLAPFRVPPEVPQVLRRGDAGAGVAWVQGQLARLEPAAAPPRGPAYFDAALEARVRKLQTAYGIRADGVVGPETLFALAALGEDGPHLARDVP